MLRKISIALLGMLFVLGLLGSPGKTSNTPHRLEEPVEESIKTRRRTQVEEESWRSEKEMLTVRFDQLRKEQKQLSRAQALLQKKIKAADKRLSEKKRELADINQITTRIQPFLYELATSLRRRIDQDPPFLVQERRQRIKKIETLMDDPEVDASERYRKVMEAMLVEAEYGFTIEAYQETIPVAGRPLLADILRLGRLGLYYRSLDGLKTGFYNVAANKWSPLPSSYTPAITAAIDIAAKREPVELLSIPLGKLVTQ
jgi:hypothetical protein